MLLQHMNRDAFRGVRSVARFRWLLCLLLALFSVGATARAKSSFEGIEADRLRRVIDHAYNLESDAPELMAQLQRDHPDSLAPEFIRVMRQYWLQNYAE